MKESRYCLEKEYAMEASGRDHSDAGSFKTLFNGCKSGSTGLEATPDYLYSEKAAYRIKNEIPGAKIVFILREPVDRLTSWFRFARMNGLIPGSMSFDEYVQLQRSGNAEDAPQHLKALEQGNYFKYIDHYVKLFGTESVLVCFYEQLSDDPLTFCKEVCRFAGLDAGYFEHFDFRIFNRTSDTKSTLLHKMFRKFKRGIRPATRLLPGSLRKRLKLAGHTLEESVIRMNSAEVPVHSSAATMNFLNEYYSSGIRQLSGHYRIPERWRHS